MGQALGIFDTALLVFGFIALFVGGFTILNTFSITVGQRTRELALLRIVGASRRQVFRSVLGEAVIVGLVASVIGLGLGVLAALGLEKLLSAFGVTLPSGSLVFQARTVVVCLIVGVGVTLVAAISPARRAVRIAPVAAVSEQQTEAEVPLRRRFTQGGVVTAIGVVLLAVGLTKPAIQLVGLGAVLDLRGRRHAGTGGGAAHGQRHRAPVGPPARHLGPVGPGELHAQPPAHRPDGGGADGGAGARLGHRRVRRLAVELGHEQRATTRSARTSSSRRRARPGTGSSAPPCPVVASGVPGVTATSVVYGGQFEFRHSLVSLLAVGTEHLKDTVILNMTAGTSRALAAGGLLVDTTTANNDHLSVGNTVPVQFALTGRSTMRIGGIYQPNALAGKYLVGDGFFLAHFQNPLPPRCS